MNQIISDFVKVAPIRFISRVTLGLRSLVVVFALSPYELGEYTIWILYVFYFSMFDFGILINLERDIPHFRGMEDQKKMEELNSVGWSSFFVLSGLGSIFLGIVVYCVFHQIILSVLLTFYLLTDKIYRAYDAHTRIYYHYKENSIAEFLLAAVSLVGILLFLKNYGIQSIFFSFILGSIAGTFYLYAKFPIRFNWTLNAAKYFQYIRQSFPLAIKYYSMDICLNSMAMTVLAIRFDKVVLGYFTFAFRIFLVFREVFPTLIQDVVRSRMYHQAAKFQDKLKTFEMLSMPLKIFGWTSVLLWLGIYWWSKWGLYHLIPKYLDSIVSLQILMLSILPLGLLNVYSDYLSSNFEKKNHLAVFAWLLGCGIQAVVLIGCPVSPERVSGFAALSYFATIMMLYFLICAISFHKRGESVFILAMRLIYPLIPLILCFTIQVGLKHFASFNPSIDFFSNLLQFTIVALSTLVLILFMEFFFRRVSFLKFLWG